MQGLIGKKLGMTGLFSPTGNYVPATVMKVGPCVVTQIKTIATDGYNALQLGFGEKKTSRMNKPMKGHLKKSTKRCFEFLREVPVDDPDKFNIGQTIGLEVFEVGENVDVTSTSKGRGFTGVVKRHGFHGGKKSHGSHSHRIPGSIGCSATPAKVVKGKKLPGQYGNERKTIKNLKIVDIRHKENLVLLKGAVSGSGYGPVIIKKLKFAGKIEPT